MQIELPWSGSILILSQPYADGRASIPIRLRCACMRTIAALPLSCVALHETEARTHGTVHSKMKSLVFKIISITYTGNLYELF